MLKKKEESKRGRGLMLLRVLIQDDSTGTNVSSPQFVLLTAPCHQPLSVHFSPLTLNASLPSYFQLPEYFLTTCADLDPGKWPYLVRVRGGSTADNQDSHLLPVSESV